MICKISLLVISFLNEQELICLHTSFAIVSTQLNGFKHTMKWLRILLLNTNYSIHSFIHSFTHSQMFLQVLLCKTNNSI